MSKEARAKETKEAPAAASKEAPKTNNPEAAGKEAVEKKSKVLIPDIIRGRMPILVVHMVRFGDQKGGETKALATMFGTTVGKITDIKKKSTFGYLPENFKPSQVQKDDAVAWLQKHVGFKDGAVDKLINEAEAYKLATKEESAEFESIRVIARGQVPKTKTGETANAGGGNRQGKAKTAAPAVQTAPAAGKPSADTLMK